MIVIAGEGSIKCNELNCGFSVAAGAVPPGAGAGAAGAAIGAAGGWGRRDRQLPQFTALDKL